MNFIKLGHKNFTTALEISSYPLKLWLTCIILGPILAYLYGIIILNTSKWTDLFETFPVFFIFGLVLSIPVAILYIIIFSYLIRQKINLVVTKFLLTTLTILGITITFKIIGGTIVNMLTGSYSVALLIGSFLYKIRVDKIASNSDENATTTNRA